MVSGVFYVNVKLNNGNLILLSSDKTTQLYYDNQVKEYNVHTASSYSITPENNLCIFFPSNLTHYVQPNLTNNERISISFNYGF